MPPELRPRRADSGETGDGGAQRIEPTVPVGRGRHAMIHALRPTLARYITAVGASALGLLLALALDPLIEVSPFLPFLAAVTISAWYGGLGPGLLATAIGVVASIYFFFVPTYALEIANLNAAVELVVFTLVAFLVSMLNAHLRDAHRRAEAARSDAEEAQRRYAFLAEAGELLDASLDYEKTLQNLTRLVVPKLADWCVVHVTVEEGESVRRITTADGDPEKEKLMQELQEGVQLDVTTPPVREVLASGWPMLYSATAGAPGGPAREHVRLLRTLGFRSVMIVPLGAGNRTLGAITFVSEQSGRRYGQLDLNLAENLARRAALALDNARLYREAREAVRGRDELLATTSHDLKNPLTFVRGRTQMLLRSVARDGVANSESLVDGLTRIEASTTRMVQLIDQLLDAANLQAGQPLELSPGPTDLVALAREVAVEHQQTVERHRIVSRTTLKTLVGEWDAARLERVLGNLISNAVKYSPQGGEITVSVAREEDEGTGWAVLTVRDPGLGIPAQEIGRVFERFYRASNVAGRISGNGIGLAGARQIVEQHGGTIAVDSQEGSGSTFTVRLPLRTTRGSP